MSQSHASSAARGAVWIFLALVTLIACPRRVHAVAPRTFKDAPSVQSALDAVEQPGVATAIRYRYLARRSPEDFDHLKAIAMLRDALSACTPGSQRWYILQALLGFASVHVRGADWRAGLKAYDVLIVSAGREPATVCPAPVSEAIREFVSFTPTRFVHLGIAQDDLVKGAMASALRLELRIGQDDGWRTAPWAEAFRAAGIDQLARTALGARWRSVAVKPYGLSKVLAGVYDADNPAEELRILEAARPALPANSPAEVAWFFGRVVGLLAGRGDWTHAGEWQRDEVRVSGMGRDRLAMLLHQAGDSAGFDSVLAEIQKPGGSEVNLVSICYSLLHWQEWRLSSGEGSSALAVRILRSYLQGARPRDAAQEMRSRACLAEWYAAHGLPDEAIAQVNAGIERGASPAP